MGYRGAILDIDGTLVDSNEAHVQAWVEVLRKHGFAVTPAEIWPRVGLRLVAASFSKADEVAIYDGPADLLARYDSSPLA